MVAGFDIARRMATSQVSVKLPQGVVCGGTFFRPLHQLATTEWREEGLELDDMRPSYGRKTGFAMPMGARLPRGSAPCGLDALPSASYAFGMAREIPSVGDLRRKSEITDAEIEAATAAFMADEGAPPFTFSSGHRIDVAKAIDMHPQAKKLLADETTAPGLRRTMVKTAVILGFPVEG